MILLRSLFFIAAFYLMSALTCLIMVPLLPMPRRVLARALRIWGGAVTWLLRTICGVRVEVRGVEHRPTGPALIAAKH
ncbi:MAG: 1-acyl-sn-glycerol-3-phosphate acyltransferase, partial [Caulobacter sp.]